jgi:hypothetical protein
MSAWQSEERLHLCAFHGFSIRSVSPESSIGGIEGARSVDFERWIKTKQYDLFLQVDLIDGSCKEKQTKRTARKKDPLDNTNGGLSSC